jgi:hypothetical protein
VSYRRAAPKGTRMKIRLLETEHVEKRKREGRLGGAEGSPPRRDRRFTNDSDSASAEATPRRKSSPTATRRVTRSAKKVEAGEVNPIQLSSSCNSPALSTRRTDSAQDASTISDIMKHFIRMEEKG